MRVSSLHLGFTLVETLITALILSLIICGTYDVLNIANIAYSTDLGLLNLQQQARQGMEWLSRETRQASLSSVNITNNGTTITFNTPNATGIQYSLSNNALVRQYPQGTNKTIANNISSLTFSKPGSVLTIKII